MALAPSMTAQSETRAARAASPEKRKTCAEWQKTSAARSARALRKVRFIHFLRSILGTGRTLRVFLYQPLGQEPRRIPLALCNLIVVLNNEPDAEPDPFYGRSSVRESIPRPDASSHYREWGQRLSKTSPNAQLPRRTADAQRGAPR